MPPLCGDVPQEEMIKLKYPSQSLFINSSVHFKTQLGPFPGHNPQKVHLHLKVCVCVCAK